MQLFALLCDNHVNITVQCVSVCAQVRSIMGQVRPDRQTLLFTATMPTKVDNLVRDCLTTPVRITVGEVGAANQDIQQVSIANLRCSIRMIFSQPLGFTAILHSSQCQESGT